MAILRTANSRGKYYDEDARYDVVNYVLNPHKAIHYYGGCGVDLTDIAESMDAVAVQYGKNDGIKLRHFILSFSPWEKITLEKVNAVGRAAVMFLGREYQCVYAVHESSDHLHIHIVMNAVSYIDGHRYRGTRQEFYAFKNYMQQVLRQFGISNLIYVSEKVKK